MASLFIVTLQEGGKSLSTTSGEMKPMATVGDPEAQSEQSRKKGIVF